MPAVKSRDTTARLVALAVVVVAVVAAAVLYRGVDDGPGVSDRSVSVTVTGGKVDPPVGRVEVGKGSTIRVTATSDVPDELHVHGYDRRASLPAGKPVTLTFTADRTGMFEVETHNAHLLLFQLVVR